MVGSIWRDVRTEFRHGNMVSRLIILNAAVFVGINILRIVLFGMNGARPNPLFDQIVQYLSVHSDGWLMLYRPWGLLTYMFLHVDFFHILFNMIYLYWFGRIVGDFIGNQRILPLYLMGGLFGAGIYFLMANLVLGAGSYALGASAAVMALVAAAGTIAPDYRMHLLLIGEVRLKYVVAVLIFLDLISVANSSNSGGHFAHLGGALFGWLCIVQLQRGNDWTQPLSRLFAKIADWWDEQVHGYQPRRPEPHVVYRNPKGVKEKRTSSPSPRRKPPVPSGHQEQLDAILDKIKQSGYDSLSQEEKEFLFNASKN